jgi:hypothetical protein
MIGAILDECDIDGELAVAADEFLGAVERIDKQKARPTSARRSAHASSSAMMGILGIAADSTSAMAFSEPISASLTGESSTLWATEKSVA